VTGPLWRCNFEREDEDLLIPYNGFDHQMPNFWNKLFSFSGKKVTARVIRNGRCRVSVHRLVTLQFAHVLQIKIVFFFLPLKFERLTDKSSGSAMHDIR